MHRGLVELHGGPVSAASEGPGRGSTFTVRLPVMSAQSAPAEPAAAPADRTGRRVLVVDDNADHADSLALLLRIAGHETGVAYDARAALELARSLKPEVAVLDIGMPELDGYWLARELRREPWARKLRLIALTGRGRERDRAEAREAGFDAHLTKPAEPEHLGALIAQE